jgi:hypothetical protein
MKILLVVILIFLIGCSTPSPWTKADTAREVGCFAIGCEKSVEAYVGALARLIKWKEGK